MAELYKTVFFNGGFIPKHEAQISIASSAVLYGLSVYTVFPVCVGSDGALLAFRLKDHFHRLINSARIIGIDTFEDEWTIESFQDVPEGRASATGLLSHPGFAEHRFEARLRAAHISLPAFAVNAGVAARVDGQRRIELARALRVACVPRMSSAVSFWRIAATGNSDATAIMPMAKMPSEISTSARVKPRRRAGRRRSVGQTFLSAAGRRPDVRTLDLGFAGRQTGMSAPRKLLMRLFPRDQPRAVRARLIMRRALDGQRPVGRPAVAAFEVAQVRGQYSAGQRQVMYQPGKILAIEVL